MRNIPIGITVERTHTTQPTQATLDVEPYVQFCRHRKVPATSAVFTHKQEREKKKEKKKEKKAECRKQQVVKLLN